MSYHIDTLMC